MLPDSAAARPDPDAVLNLLNFDLPPALIAQTGVEPRDSSRLMVVGQSGIRHTVFHDLPALLRPGDLMVFNESRVIPARVLAHKPAGRREAAALRRRRSAAPGARRYAAAAAIHFGRPGTVL